MSSRAWLLWPAGALGAAVLLGPARLGALPPAGAPPNRPATVAFDGSRLRLVYDGLEVVSGTVGADGPATLDYRSAQQDDGGRITQALKWTARGPGRARLALTVAGSEEAFAAEADRRAESPPLVRASIGPSHNLRNRAVYDRRRDWVVSVDAGPEVTVRPAPAASEGASFALDASGGEIVLRFRPRFYQRHRGLARFEPWTYAAWRTSVAGWTSWFAFRDRVTEADIAATAEVLAERLAAYGYEYLQIDDGYQQTPMGTPDTWLRTNERFPGGLAGLVRTIAGRGLRPGLWTNTTFAQREYAEAHPEYFVRTADGRPAFGNWVGYVMDGSNPRTLDELVRPVYRALRQMGWEYFKVDALRHLRYEGYNSHQEWFAARGLDRVEAYRAFARAIRDEIGPAPFKLACWGVRPELVGLFDGVRVGTDGFGYGGFSQYNSFNNVVWRNDPDHIELAQPDAYRALSITSLTGSVLMLTDKPEVYLTDRVEAARRTAPVPFAVPGQLYDVDSSRSEALARAEIELSGSGPRPFDATQRAAADYLYAVEVARPFERWMVVARTGGETPIRFADLGLPEREALVYEFWTKTLLGSFQGAFSPPAVDPGFGVQVLCLRERLDHPQLVATNRHVTCGAPDLHEVAWTPGALSGRSDLVGGEVYELVLTEPPGFAFEGASVEGGELLGTTRSGLARTVRLRSPASTRVSWRIAYRPA